MALFESFGTTLIVEQVHFPLMREEESRMLLLQDITLRLPNASLLMEGWVVLEHDAANVDAGTPGSWRLRSVDLSRAKTMPPMPSLLPTGR